MQDIRDMAVYIDNPNLIRVNTPLHSIVHLGTNLAAAVYNIFPACKGEKLRETGSKIADMLRAIIDLAKSLAAAASGQLRIGLPTLTQALHSACDMIDDLMKHPIQNEEHHKQALMEMVTLADIVAECLTQEADAYSVLYPAVSSIAQSVTTLATELTHGILCLTLFFG